MTMRILTTAALALVLDAATPRAAHADWLLTPYLGVTFGGDAEKQQVNYGLSAAFLGGGIFGIEVDAALTPNFFESDSGLIDDSNVSTLMANLMVAAPDGRAAPALRLGRGRHHPLQGHQRGQLLRPR